MSKTLVDAIYYTAKKHHKSEITELDHDIFIEAYHKSSATNSSTGAGMVLQCLTALDGHMYRFDNKSDKFEKLSSKTYRVRSNEIDHLTKNIETNKLKRLQLKLPLTKLINELQTAIVANDLDRVEEVSLLIQDEIDEIEIEFKTIHQRINNQEKQLYHLRKKEKENEK